MMPTPELVNLIKACGITLDISKQNLLLSEYRKLVELGQGKCLIEKFLAMCAGEIVNSSEKRAALHTSLRAIDSSAPFFISVSETLGKILNFAEQVRSGFWTGSSNQQITDIINVGIGGSDMGPKAVWQALKPLKPSINLHFMSAADGVAFERITWLFTL